MHFRKQYEYIATKMLIFFLLCCNVHIYISFMRSLQSPNVSTEIHQDVHKIHNSKSFKMHFLPLVQ